MTDIWHAKTYTKFLDLRTKPAQDLLFAIPKSFTPEIVYDLGCGPGNSTVLLKERWPDAKIIGLDSSLDMLQEAKETYPELEFIAGDIATFIPQEKPDCIFANASLQWVEGHQVLIPKLLNWLKPQGVLAIQMPNNFHYPSHQVTINLLKQHAHWHSLLHVLRYGQLTKPFYNAAYYYDLLTEAKARQVQLWETEYFQEMPDYQSIFDWVQGTGLRPILSKMECVDQDAFEKAYVVAVSKEYPRQKMVIFCFHTGVFSWLLLHKHLLKERSNVEKYKNHAAIEYRFTHYTRPLWRRRFFC